MKDNRTLTKHGYWTTKHMHICSTI